MTQNHLISGLFSTADADCRHGSWSLNPDHTVLGVQIKSLTYLSYLYLSHQPGQNYAYLSDILPTDPPPGLPIPGGAVGCVLTPPSPPPTPLVAVGLPDRLNGCWERGNWLATAGWSTGLRLLVLPVPLPPFRWFCIREGRWWWWCCGKKNETSVNIVYYQPPQIKPGFFTSPKNLYDIKLKEMIVWKI